MCIRGENILIEYNLYNDDCINVLKKIDNNKVDLILTDPPYNLGNFMKNRDTNLNKMRDNFFVGAGWDNLETTDWEQSMDDFFKESSRIIKIGGSAIVFMSIIKVETIIRIAEKHGFYYKTTGIWHKTNPMPRNMNIHFVNSTETWIYFVYDKKSGTFNNEGKMLHDFIETSATPLSEKKHGKHPTQKPQKIMSYFVNVLSDDYDVVLDPFMGSGTAGVAAVQNNRNFIGVELNSDYYNIAKSRIEEVIDEQ